MESFGFISLIILGLFDCIVYSYIVIDCSCNYMSKHHIIDDGYVIICVSAIISIFTVLFIFATTLILASYIYTILVMGVPIIITIVLYNRKKHKQKINML